MGVLQRFEKRLETVVEGTFAKVFKGVVHPVEIASALQREAEIHKSIIGSGRTLAPNLYIIKLSLPDHERLAPYALGLAQELAQTQAEFIGEQGWTVYGDVIVEIEREDSLETGMFRVSAEVFTGNPETSLQPQIIHTPEPIVQPTVNMTLLSATGQTYSLPLGSTVIGRGEDSQLRLADGGVSRMHARIDRTEDSTMITDLGSTNGTMVNGQHVMSAVLQAGDVINVGSTSLTVRQGM